MREPAACAGSLMRAPFTGPSNSAVYMHTQVVKILASLLLIK